MNNGFIKLYRSLQEKGYYKDSEYVHLWVHLLFKASFQPKEFMVNGNLLSLKPGQFVTSRAALSRETGINESKIERVLSVFKTGQQIEQQSFSKFRLISIINWNMYQLGEQQKEHQMNTKRTASEQQVNTINKDKKEKNNKTFSSGSVEYGLADFLYQKILDLYPDIKPPNIQTWSSDIDKMIRLDKRDSDEISDVIEWCQKDPFWRVNILSTESLRKQYDKLVVKMRNGGQPRREACER